MHDIFIILFSASLIGLLIYYKAKDHKSDKMWEEIIGKNKEEGK